MFWQRRRGFDVVCVVVVVLLLVVTFLNFFLQIFSFETLLFEQFTHDLMNCYPYYVQTWNNNQEWKYNTGRTRQCSINNNQKKKISFSSKCSGGTYIARWIVHKTQKKTFFISFRLIFRCCFFFFFSLSSETVVRLARVCA